jgi:hypothetical protein
MAKPTYHYALGELAQALSAVAARLEPKEATAVCGHAATTLRQTMTKTTADSELGQLALGLAAVAARLEPKEATAVCGHAAANLSEAMSKSSKPWELKRVLLAVLCRESVPTFAQHSASVAATVAAPALAGMPLTVPALLHPALKPLPPPLPAQTLVDLLKQPLCVGEARRLVLGQLARHYHRPFADLWQFVDYARQQGLPLDLASPPQRPALAVAAPPR